MRQLTRLAKEERGNVLMIFAAALPAMILILALSLDFGNWFAHKRKLQNRVDNGVFATAVEYGYRFPICTDNTANGNAHETAIATVARQFAGDESVLPLTVHNTGVNKATPGTTFETSDPCAWHPPNTDTTSPLGGYWTQVRGAETNIVSLVGGFGVPVPAITASARLALMQPDSVLGARPLAVADPMTTQCARAILHVPGADQPVTLTNPSGDGITWTADETFTMPSANDPTIPIDIHLGNQTDCTDPGTDIVTYANVGTVTSWDTGTPPPDVEDVQLERSSSSDPCANGYFVPRPSSSTAPAPTCGVEVRAWFDFITTDPARPPRVRNLLTGETLDWNGNPTVFSPAAISPGSGVHDVDIELCNPAAFPVPLPGEPEPCADGSPNWTPFENTAFINAGNDNAIGPIENLSVVVAGNEERRLPEAPDPGATVTATITLILRPLRSDEPNDFATVIRAAPQEPYNRSSAVTCGGAPASTFVGGCTSLTIGDTIPFDSATLISQYNELWAPVGECTDNNWPKYGALPPNPEIPWTDPRLITVLLTPLTDNYQAAGPHQITSVAAFYVTGWDGSPGTCEDDDPAGTDNEPFPEATADYPGDAASAAWGHFVKFVLLPSGGTPTETPCEWIGIDTVDTDGDPADGSPTGRRDDVEACIAALVR